MATGGTGDVLAGLVGALLAGGPLAPGGGAGGGLGPRARRGPGGAAARPAGHAGRRSGRAPSATVWAEWGNADPRAQPVFAGRPGQPLRPRPRGPWASAWERCSGPATWWRWRASWARGRPSWSAAPARAPGSRPARSRARPSPSWPPTAGACRSTTPTSTGSATRTSSTRPGSATWSAGRGRCWWSGPTGSPVRCPSSGSRSGWRTMPGAPSRRQLEVEGRGVRAAELGRALLGRKRTRAGRAAQVRRPAGRPGP